MLLYYSRQCSRKRSLVLYLFCSSTHTSLSVRSRCDVGREGRREGRRGEGGREGWREGGTEGGREGGRAGTFSSGVSVAMYH